MEEIKGMIQYHTFIPYERVIKIKDKKTISIERWIIAEIQRQHPEARRNFSKVVEWMLISSVNNPKQFWRSKIKYHQQSLHAAVDTMKRIEEMKTE